MEERQTPRLVEVEIRGAIAEIALNAGPLNLVTREVLRALNTAIRSLGQSDGVRCVILHGGTARAFCAGSDINEFAGIKADASEQKILFEDMVLRALAALPMPTIAAIDGPALGGGLELALACDLRVLRAGVAVGLTESQLGGLGASGAVRLTHLVGPARAKEMLFTGEPIIAETAAAWGVVNHLADTSALELARKLASKIAARGPVSNREGKRLVAAALAMPTDAALSAANIAQQVIFDSADLDEGVAAFFAKRTPEFSGR
ncbi:enoyl-CoA hydratase-related protein [Acuticoccus sp. MNP-M23]|uniref:enoyl-CoA hydratase/isomerase family protein n=1 Tax=Acuticoccus sp. MNP-M23 TaxID=3072793 RepID=UPI00281567A6|nr:enoyl-CoA hydratase-related protein [Acuticoccus sp. MNP-M23]WMS40957.1 enoyl-CoA hydratase-related protein [Acuticoccus sp. MNP-M23]